MAPSQLFKEHDLIINIGSGNVSGAIVDFSKHAHPEIIHAHESFFQVRGEMDSFELTTQMLSALHSIVSKLHAEYKRKIKNTHIVLSSPWFSSFIKPISIKKNDSFLVSEKNLERLSEDELESFLKKSTDNQEIILERAISRVRINGYQTTNPFGKMAKAVDLSVYGSTIPTIVKEKIESEIFTVIHPHKISFHTFPFVAWNTISSLFSPREDFIFIDIGSEVSDLLVVRHGTIYSVASFPIGKNHLSRKIALNVESHPELAQSLMNLYSEQCLEPESEKKLGGLVSAFGEEWALYFSQSIQAKGGEHEHFVPQKVYFLSNPNVSRVFSDIITKKAAHPIPLSRETLSQFITFKQTEIPDSFIALESIYFNASNFGNNETSNTQNNQ